PVEGTPMKISSPILILCVGVLVGLVSDGWGQAAQDSEADSKLVKAVIEQTQKANDARDLNLFLAQYSDDAMIDSKAARAKVSKAAFKEAVSRLWQQDPQTWSEQKGVQVSIVDATHAV